MYILKYYEPHHTGKLYLVTNDVVLDNLVLGAEQINNCLKGKLKPFDITKSGCVDAELLAARSLVSYYVIKQNVGSSILPDIYSVQQTLLYLRGMEL